jgi:hypothetical protein
MSHALSGIHELVTVKVEVSPVSISSMQPILSKRVPKKTPVLTSLTSWNAVCGVESGEVYQCSSDEDLTGE